MELKLIPSILSADFGKLAEQITMVQEAGADMIHIDSMDNHYVPNLTIGPIVVKCNKKYGAKAGIALNPATPISTLEEIIDEVDYILIMTVNPGFASQPFIESCLKKIQKLKNILTKKLLNIPIEVDGGIKYENAEQVIKQGAKWIVIGSGIFSKTDPAKETIKIKNLFKKLENNMN